MADHLVIRAPRREELRPAADLLRRSLGFSAADGVPAWLMSTTTAAGGLLLVAVREGEVVGVSYAFPGWEDGVPFLFSCGLAIAPDRRGQGIGRALKGEQRQRARAVGYVAIRWTADPLNAVALRLYLSGLGARITAYHAGLHDGVRTGDDLPQDDVDVEWPLESVPAPRSAVSAVADVALPRADRPRTLHDRLRVRAEMQRLLAAGFVGTAVEANGERSAVRFEREERR